MSGTRESGAAAGPPSGRSPVRRRVVVAIDNAVRATPLVLVSAPTGYGKSVALGAWAHRRGDVGWAAARAGADTAAVLAAGIDAAARAAGVVDPDADFADAALDGPPSASELISRLARLLQDVPRPLTLVIDDAHLLDPAMLVATVCSDPVLATGLLRMVLVGNLRLGPVYARHLASGTATLIGPDVLALTPAEVAVAVRSDADAAYADTEGWPLAVGYRSPDRRASAGLTLTDRVDDLLWAVRPELRAFVLDAVVLPTLDETLVRRVAGIEGAAALLEEAAESALPLTRFYDAADRVRYRWHPVFAVHCLRIAERADPARVRTLRLAAAAETADADPLTAAELTVRAGDVDGAAVLVRSSWLRILTTGDVHALEAVCRSLPAHMQESPEILRILACCRTVLGDEEGAAELLRRARRPGTGAGRGRLSSVELFTDLFLEHDPAAGERLVAAAEERLSDPHGSLDRPHALYLAGRSQLLLSPWAPRARWLLQAAAEEAEARGLSVLAGHARLDLAMSLATGGEFTAALAGLDAVGDVESGSDWGRFHRGAVATMRGYIHLLWRGEPGPALTLLRSVVDDTNVAPLYSALARVTFAYLAAQSGDRTLIEEAGWVLAVVPTGNDRGLQFDQIRRVARAHLKLATGAQDEAVRLVGPLVEARVPGILLVRVAEVLWRAGRLDLADTALRRAGRSRLPRYGRVSALLVLGMLQADSEQPESGRHHLGSALDHAAPEGVLGPFLMPDPRIGVALESLARSGSRHESLLSTIIARRGLERGEENPLTAREREILGLLHTPMTIVEIGVHLGLAASTIKTHTRRIYRKLGVADRREAVRASSAGGSSTSH